MTQFSREILQFIRYWRHELRERAWDRKMARHPEVFDALAAEAIAEYERGETVEGG